MSAFDHVLTPGIPGKGAVLTEVSGWWFAQLPEVENHLLADAPPAVVADRANVVQRLAMFPVECVVRGHLVGSGWAEYRADGTVCGIPLPAGLGEGDALPEPIYTPAFKAPAGEHDANISFDDTVELVGREVAERLRELSLHVFRRASELAAARGILLADTKFEFGADPRGVIRLADEVLTPDSSRYWDAEAYVAGGPDRLASFDKQIVRDWLLAHWDRSPGPDGSEPAPPALPDEIVARTASRYRDLRDRLLRG